MSGFIPSFVSNLSLSAFYDVLTSIVPLLLLLVPVVFGIYLVRKMVSLSQWVGIDYSDLSDKSDKKQWLKDHRF